MSQQCMKEARETVVITAKGKSKEDTIGKIFNMLRGQIFEKVNRPIVHMNTEEVYIESVDERKYTERFMFIFMPREKSEFTITAKIVVDVKYIEI